MLLFFSRFFSSLLSFLSFYFFTFLPSLLDNLLSSLYFFCVLALFSIFLVCCLYVLSFLSLFPLSLSLSLCSCFVYSLSCLHCLFLCFLLFSRLLSFKWHLKEAKTGQFFSCLFLLFFIPQVSITLSSPVLHGKVIRWIPRLF